MGEQDTETTQKACEACDIEKRLTFLEEGIKEAQSVLKELRKETKLIRTLLEPKEK